MTKQIDIECPGCKGTGLYSGLDEQDGAAVVCHTCRGTGRFTYIYTPFVKRKPPKKPIVRVYQRNPGISIGECNGYHLDDFGGIPYEQWLADSGMFPQGCEDRLHTCPAWFHQIGIGDFKPCPVSQLGRTYSSCPKFRNKVECWKEYDLL